MEQFAGSTRSSRLCTAPAYHCCPVYCCCHVIAEHKGAVLDLLPMGDYSARGTFIAKAWKVCDCVNGFGFSFDGLSVKIGQNGGLRLSTAKFPMSPTFPFLKKHLMNMTLPDVISQWVAANQADAKIPEVTVSEEQLSKIKILLPDFAVPSIVVPKISAPLLDMPAHISLPVFTIPFGNKTLHRFTLIVPNVTSLPTLIMAKAHAAPSNLKITIPEVGVPGLSPGGKFACVCIILTAPHRAVTDNVVLN